MGLASEEGVLPPEEVRARRLFHEERPLWRSALALPADALSVAAWPIEKALVWIEDVNLPERVERAVSAPFRSAADR